MKIKTLLLAYVLAVIVLACTHSPLLQKDAELYSQYLNYIALLNANDNYNSSQLELIFNSYSVPKQQSLLNAQIKTTSLLQQLASAYLSFPLAIEKEFNHYETIAGERGCLLINGYKPDLQPLSISISFVKSDRWVIDDVHVENLAPFNKFLHKAVCDDQKLAMIRIKEMM